MDPINTLASKRPTALFDPALFDHQRENKMLEIKINLSSSMKRTNTMYAQPDPPAIIEETEEIREKNIKGILEAAFPKIRAELVQVFERNCFQEDESELLLSNALYRGDQSSFQSYPERVKKMNSELEKAYGGYSEHVVEKVMETLALEKIESPIISPNMVSKMRFSPF